MGKSVEYYHGKRPDGTFVIYRRVVSIEDSVVVEGMSGLHVERLVAELRVARDSCSHERFGKKERE